MAVKVRYTYMQTTEDEMQQVFKYRSTHTAETQ